MEPPTTDTSRGNLCSEPRIRRLLAAMTKPEGTLTPRRVLDGDYRYHEAEEILQASPEETLALLNKLSEARTLEKEILLTQPVCPACKSAQLKTSLRCPFCEGNELRKVVLLKHLSCGYMGSEEEFSIHGQLVCPMCRQPTGSGEHSRNEDGFECKSCLKVTEVPLTRQECGSCGRTHNNESVELSPVYAFKVNSHLREEILESCRIDFALSRHLTAKGFTVTSPAVVKGASITYSVDILAKGKSETVVAHVLDLGRPATVDDVVKVLVPTTDIRPDKSILATIPPLPEKVKRLAKLYGLIFIEGNSMSDITSQMEQLL
jgi:hypothetical protein